MQTSSAYLIYFHSILRYVILLLAVVVVLQSLVGMLGKKTFQKGNRMTALFLLISCDLQLVAGLVLYYYKVIATGLLKSPDLMTNVASRFYAVEHSVSMIIGIVLVHIGYNVTKKSIGDEAKFKRLFWCSFIALAIFMAMIPWPGKQVVGRPYIPVMPA
jgi:uncharacterized membrane protein